MDSVPPPLSGSLSLFWFSFRTTHHSLLNVSQKSDHFSFFHRLILSCFGASSQSDPWLVSFIRVQTGLSTNPASRTYPVSSCLTRRTETKAHQLAATIYRYGPRHLRRMWTTMVLKTWTGTEPNEVAPNQDLSQTENINVQQHVYDKFKLPLVDNQDYYVQVGYRTHKRLRYYLF